MKRLSTNDDSNLDFQEEEIELSVVRNPIQFNHEKLPENDQIDPNINNNINNEDNNDEEEVTDESLYPYFGNSKFSHYKHLIEKYLHDPRVPREAQLFRKENICVLLCYVLVGLFEGITRVVMNGNNHHHLLLRLLFKYNKL